MFSALIIREIAMELKAIDEDLESVQYPIRPEDIDANRHFFGAFGKGEVEIAAKYIVRFCQQLGGWKALTVEEINNFYRENGGLTEWVFNRRDTFPFHWLNEKLLARRQDGKCCVTNLFINRCFQSSPKNKDF
jgi:hypothetical protein